MKAEEKEQKLWEATLAILTGYAGNPKLISPIDMPITRIIDVARRTVDKYDKVAKELRFADMPNCSKQIFD